MDLYLSLLSSILGIITAFLVIKGEAKKVRVVLISTGFLICVISGITAYTILENNRLKSPQNKIQVFLKQWGNKDVNFISNGELKGAMIEGMIVLESMKDQFPDNYEKAKDLIYKGHDPRVDRDFWEERQKLEDGFDAMLGIMKGLKML